MLRSHVWVLDPALDAARVESMLGSLTARGITASLREVAGGARVVVVQDAPADIVVPAGVLRSTAVETAEGGTISRRALLEVFASGLAVATVGGAAVVSTIYPIPPRSREDDSEEVEAGSLAELQVKGSKRFRFGREPALVVLSGGALYALSAVCTHRACLVEWSPERRQIVCPCHDASFDLEGNVLEGPPPRPLSSFSVTVQGDRVLVRRRSES